MLNLARARSRRGAPLAWADLGPLSDWGAALVGACGVYFAVFVVWIAERAFGMTPSAIVADLSYLPFELVAAAVAVRASTGAGLEAQTRRAWRIMGAAYLVTWLVGASWIYYDLVGEPAVPLWFKQLVRALHWSRYPLLLWSLLSFPRSPRTAVERAKFWLDAGTVLIAAGALVWHVVLAPVAGARQTDTELLLYPTLDFVVLFGIAALALRLGGGSRGRALRILAVATLALIAADCLYIRAKSLGAYESGDWPDRLWAAAAWITALAAHAQYWQAPRDATDVAVAPPLDATRPPTYSLLPYASVLAVYALLLVRSVPPSAPPLTLVAAAVLLTAVVMARQVVALRENAALAAERLAREARFRSLVQRASDLITIVDAGGVILYQSPSAEALLGYAPDAMVGTSLIALAHDEDAASFAAFIGTAAATDAVPTHAWRLRTRSGAWRAVETVATNLLRDPAVGGIVLNTRDVSERAALEAELTRQAYSDAVTGLANRTRFRERVVRALARADNTPEAAAGAGGVAVLFIDLDNFKTVNDSLGHHAGDQLLAVVAERLLNATRGCDTVARLGGDEFAILLANARTPDDAVVVAERITRAMECPVVVEGREAFVGTSIGIARRAGREGADELLRNADLAMYTAKRGGKRRHQVFEPGMHAPAIERLQLEADLRRAIDRGEITVRYQPIVNLRAGRVVGVEALARWTHPDRGEISPTTFIPLAEETGLIVPLGRRVLEEACRRLRELPPQGRGAAALGIAVNISARQLHDAGLVDDVAAILTTTGLAPERLTLEITESVLMRHADETLERLRAIKALGVRLAIDDFGTGYSSLAYLQRFPVDVLKIDKAFVDGVDRGGSNAALARTILALGDTLGLRCVAEGIEHAAQRDSLAALGCDYGQGYFFAKPMEPLALAAFLRGGDPRDRADEGAYRATPAHALAAAD